MCHIFTQRTINPQSSINDFRLQCSQSPHIIQYISALIRIGKVSFNAFRCWIRRNLWDVVWVSVFRQTDLRFFIITAELKAKLSICFVPGENGSNNEKAEDWGFEVYHFTESIEQAVITSSTRYHCPSSCPRCIAAKPYQIHTRHGWKLQRYK